MHVLVVLDHPKPGSFCSAVAAKFREGAEFAGHTVEMADLHREGFDPRWTIEDVDADGPETTPKDILKEQARIERADAVCFIFPLFWWSMPSMTKGWVDRVWSWGWAYEQLDDPDKSLQRPRTGVFLIPAGARSDEMDKLGYADALETLWIKGTFGYFGFVERKLHILNGSTGSDERREALLTRAYQAGVDIPYPPDEHQTTKT